MAAACFDVVVMGAGIGGAIAALGFAQHGLRVAVVDRKPDAASHKVLCTHCVQPIALPVLRRLGLEEGLLAAGAVPTKMVVRTRVGLIDPPGDGYDSAGTLTALNAERRLLDPFLASRLRDCGHVDLRLNTSLVAADRLGDGSWAVELDREGVGESLVCRLLVAADGRGSRLAKLLGNPERLRGENDRSCTFAYFEGVPPTPSLRTLYLLGDDDEAIFHYPLAAGRALLAAFMPKDKPLPGRTPPEKARALIGLFAGRAPAPDLSQARLASGVHGYLDYPSVIRQSAVHGVPFVGDAAMSLDPMSGSGCAFAVVAADLLVEETAGALAAGDDPAAAVARYASRHDAYFGPRAQGIVADSRVGKSRTAIDAVHRRICAEPALQHAFLALIGRLTTPSEFQRAFLATGAKRREPEAAVP